MKMAVYGSLRKKHYNHSLMGPGKYLGTVEVDGFKLYDLGVYPCIVPTKDKRSVVFEIYEFDDKKHADTIGFINGMERGAGYEIGTMGTKYGDVTYYYFEDTPLSANEVLSGDWDNR